MPLTKTDLEDAKMLLQAGNIDATRRILRSSNDPRAMQLLAKLDDHFPVESQAGSGQTIDLRHIKHLIMQKKFDAAEALLRDSGHPDADRYLQKIGMMKAKAGSKSRNNSTWRGRSLWKHIAVTVYSFISSN